MNLKKFLYYTALPCLIMLLSPTVSMSFSNAYLLSHKAEVFGSLTEYRIRNDRETLVELAIKYDIGYNEISDANPDVDPWYPGSGKRVLIPTSWILPEVDLSSPVSSEGFYTVQTGSFLNPEPARKHFDSLTERLSGTELHYLRVEKVDNFYTVRVGKFEDKSRAKKLLHIVKPLFPEAIILKAHIKNERIFLLNRRKSSKDSADVKKEISIVINLAELRLYLIQGGTNGLSVITFPIGIGREGLDTPVGRYRVIEKRKDPVWVIPESIRAEYPEFPAVVPSGPDNPLGRYALRLSNPEYLIHGTNKPLGVGRRVSHGCIRMYPEDIERLYSMVDTGIKVVITYQPVKIGVRGDIPYIEVHRDYLDRGNRFQDAVNLLRRLDLLAKIDTALLYKALNEKRGVPVRLTPPQNFERDRELGALH